MSSIQKVLLGWTDPQTEDCLETTVPPIFRVRTPIINRRGFDADLSASSKDRRHFPLLAYESYRNRLVSGESEFVNVVAKLRWKSEDQIWSAFFGSKVPAKYRGDLDPV